MKVRSVLRYLEVHETGWGYQIPVHWCNLGKEEEYLFIAQANFLENKGPALLVNREIQKSGKQCHESSRRLLDKKEVESKM